MSLTKYIAMTVIIAAAFIVVVALPMKNDGSEKTSIEANTESKVQTIYLTEEDKYRGDLILVNNQNEYHFEYASKTDLIKLYNVKSDFYQVKDTKVRVAKRIVGPLNRMLEAFYNKTKLSTTEILSGYRTKEYQAKLFREDVRDNGEIHAKGYIANAGYSEHHIGLAIDFGVQYSDGTLGSFMNSDNEKWITKKSYKYGFIHRYFDEKSSLTGISGESWHFRFVGLPHSYYINKNKLCMEEYISFIQNNATSSFPLTITYQDTSYDVYYTKESSIEIPKDAFYTISGDNQGGYIITTAKEERAFSAPPVNAVSGSSIEAAVITGGALSGNTVSVPDDAISNH